MDNRLNSKAFEEAAKNGDWIVSSRDESGEIIFKSFPGNCHPLDVNVEESLDPLEALKDAMSEAAQHKWEKKHYSRAYFCHINELSTFQKHPEPFEDNFVYSVENYIRHCYEENWHHPVSTVAFCGKIIASEISKGFCWYEVQDNTGGKILCIEDVFSDTNLERQKSQYHDIHKNFRQKEAINLDVSVSAARWLIARRVKALYQQENELQLTQDFDDLKDKSVFVYGKLSEKNNTRNVFVKKICFMKAGHEKWFNECLKLGRWHQEIFKSQKQEGNSI